MTSNPKGDHLLALDVGDRRVGVAIASHIARLARPLLALGNDAKLFENLQKIITDENVDQVVVGLPRNQQGRETAQSVIVRQFAKKLAQYLHLPVYLSDESVTSLQAEAELRIKGKPYARGDIDAQAAAIILQGFLDEKDRRELSD